MPFSLNVQQWIFTFSKDVENYLCKKTKIDVKRQNSEPLFKKNIFFVCVVLDVLKNWNDIEEEAGRMINSPQWPIVDDFMKN